MESLMEQGDGEALERAIHHASFARANWRMGNPPS
jgi:hypothetical protein